MIKSNSKSNNKNQKFKEDKTLWIKQYRELFKNPDYINQTDLKKYVKEAKKIGFTRVLTPNYPERKYSDKFREPKQYHKIHKGQRKLLLSEIEFLTNYWNPKIKSPIILYVGSAPGWHTYFMAKHLFPDCRFILYDKNRFNPALYTLPNVEIHEAYFDANTANEYKGKELAKSIYFISDIRSFDKGVSNDSIQEDMKLQKEWFDIIRPYKALFKFRLSWEVPKTMYLRGTIYFQVWQTYHSTETRFVPDDDGKIVEYDNKKYEDQMFFFNTVGRRIEYKGICSTNNHNHNHNHNHNTKKMKKMKNVNKYGDDYDSKSECYILSNYLKKFGNTDLNFKDVYEFGKYISNDIKQYLYKSI